MNTDQNPQDGTVVETSAQQTSLRKLAALDRDKEIAEIERQLEIAALISTWEL